jgi:hypothetical protein
MKPPARFFWHRNPKCKGCGHRRSEHTQHGLMGCTNHSITYILGVEALPRIREKISVICPCEFSRDEIDLHHAIIS